MTRRRTWLRWLFAVIGVAYVVVAVVTAANEGLLQAPNPWVLVLSAILIAIGLLAAAASWGLLFDDTKERQRLRSVFFLGQLGKYTPAGGFGQAVGQIGLSTNESLTTSVVTGAFVLHGLLQLAAAAVVGGFLVFDGSLPTWVRVLVSIGFLAPLAVVSPWLDRIVERVTRRFPRIGIEMPNASVRLKVVALLIVPLTCAGLALGLVLNDISAISPVGVVPAFSAAWAVGFLALPVPGGLGVREATLAFLLPQTAGVVAAASVVIRVVTIVAESGLAGISWRAGALRLGRQTRD